MLRVRPDPRSTCIVGISLAARIALPLVGPFASKDRITESTSDLMMHSRVSKCVIIYFSRSIGWVDLGKTHVSIKRFKICLLMCLHITRCSTVHGVLRQTRGCSSTCAGATVPSPRRAGCKNGALHREQDVLKKCCTRPEMACERRHLEMTHHRRHAHAWSIPWPCMVRCACEVVFMTTFLKKGTYCLNPHLGVQPRTHHHTSHDLSSCCSYEFTINWT